MDSSRVKRVLTIVNSQESNGLLIEPVADSGNILEFLAARELAFLATVINDALSNASRDPRNAGKQVNRSRVEIDSILMYTRLYRQPELGPQLRGLNFRVILPDSEEPRIDFD